jgi:sugar lactone lactonase YvrE
MYTTSIFRSCLTSLFTASVLLTAVGCAPAQPEPVAPPPPPPPAPTADSASATTPPPAADANAEPQMKPPVVVKDAGFLAPESVLYDADQDLYFVSNVNGNPLDKDGNGFIAKVSPEGKVMDLKFIAGGQKGVALDAPKGMAIVGDLLYVTDITWVRIFDRKTGAAKGKLFVQGATFLNDIAADADGKLYLTDTGWKAGEKDFESTGTDAVFVIDPKVVMPKKVLADPKLGNPNGVVASKDGVWIVTASGELFSLQDGKKAQTTKLPNGGLDGLVALADGTFLASSWAASAVYHGKPGGEFKVIIDNTKSPADIGYDTKRHRLLMPQMMENTVRLYDLPAAGAKPAAPVPAQPAEAAKPAAGAKPATPAKPAAGAKPATPAKPAAGAKPATPAKPAAGAKPASTNSPAAPQPAVPPAAGK